MMVAAILEDLALNRACDLVYVGWH